jgi:GT2 family glycosyltransferase
MNLGWEARDHDSRYVAFLNNDLIADTVSLREIVERMDAEPDVGAASGLIHFGDGRTIFSAGTSLPHCGIRGEYATALPSLSATEGGELATSPTPMALIWWREYMPSEIRL